MNKLLFDEEGKFIGVDSKSGGEIPDRRRRTSLMTSQELSFLKREESAHQFHDSPYWSLYTNGNKLEPLKYSNGKTQEDVVREAASLIKNGTKVILIHGVCGTGKSAIALNLARVFGRTSIVVPVKNLQKQYEEDYTKNKYLLKPNGTKMTIAVITGRANHDSIIEPGVPCSDPFLPDTILITEKNRDKLLRYYNQNPFIRNKTISHVNSLRRISIAPSNPYWSPISPADFVLSQLDDAKRKHYFGVSGREYIFYHRKEGCSYYDQFQAYLDADVIIFNSAKYEIEMAIGRKPETEIDVIDEADAFLDNFSKEESINLTRLGVSLQNVFPEHEEAQNTLHKLKELLILEQKNKTASGVDERQIFSLRDTFTGKALKVLLNSSALQAEISLDEAHYYVGKFLEAALIFDDLYDDTYVTYSRKDDELYINLVTTNIAKRFAELCARTKTLVLMSGTVHSEEVLKNVFGVKNFAVVEAETSLPGKMEVCEGGYEINCDYSKLKNKRREYLLALSECLGKIKKPALVHVNSYEDLPNEKELNEFLINNVISREQLKELQAKDKTGEEVARFKAKESDILFSTKCSRGVDFPGDTCNSVVFTKYPNPSLQNTFWKVLKQTHPQYFWSVYRDKAWREFLQRIYRALRSKEDHVYVFSPDSRVLEKAKKLLR